MEVDGKVLVLGMGASGNAAARLLASRGRKVTAIDSAQTPEVMDAAGRLGEEGIEAIAGCRDVPGDDFGLCVVSPGIGAGSPWVRTLEERGVPLLSELELGWLYCRSPVIAITGTNGKSTATRLCAEIVRADGKTCAAGGNYGTALSAIACEDQEYDWIVAEVSSFQMEFARDFRPEVGVLLNISEDHLDRHQSFAEYAELKFRLFSNMPGGSRAVIEEQVLRDHAGQAKIRDDWTVFGTGPASHYRYAESAVSHGHEHLDLSGTFFDCETMGRTAAAAWAVSDACGLSKTSVEEALRQFRPLPHRMEFVAASGGRRFVDDSKATNIAAMAAALKSSPGKARLIAGGILKEFDAGKIKELLEIKVKSAYVLGKDAGVLISSWQDTIPCTKCVSMEQAVRLAWQDSDKGDTILLSPGAASFDSYSGFEERGKDFKEQVLKVIEEES